MGSSQDAGASGCVGLSPTPRRSERRSSRPINDNLAARQPVVSALLIGSYRSV